MDKAKSANFSKAKKQKLLLYVLGAVVVIILIIFGIIKYIEYSDPLNYFDFDAISPEGVYNNLQTAETPVQQIDQ